jgi:carboxymethylenebutenolidase
MGEMVEFPSNGSTGGGYLAPAREGAGLGLIVVQEGWGLVDHIVDVCDRFAAEGFTTLAPDLSHGHAVPDGEPDLERATRDLSSAVDFLPPHPAVRGHGVAAVGFGLGGGLALWLATLRPDAVRAVVPFYGLAPPNAQPDWPALTAAVEGHYAEHDDQGGPEAVAAFEERLRDLGKDVRIFTYPHAGHAFFDDTRPDVHHEEASRQAWVRTLEFLRAKLG